jgi:hypothetical protein
VPPLKAKLSELEGVVPTLQSLRQQLEQHQQQLLQQQGGKGKDEDQDEGRDRALPGSGTAAQQGEGRGDLVGASGAALAAAVSGVQRDIVELREAVGGTQQALQVGL